MPVLHSNSFLLCLGKLFIIQTLIPHLWSKVENDQTYHLKSLLVAFSWHSLDSVLFPMPGK